jgi:hypothetical protein
MHERFGTFPAEARGETEKPNPPTRGAWSLKFKQVPGKHESASSIRQLTLIAASWVHQEPGGTPKREMYETIEVSRKGPGAQDHPDCPDNSTRDVAFSHSFCLAGM